MATLNYLTAMHYFAAYLQERFPPVNMGLFAILFGTVYSIVHLQGLPGNFGMEEIIGIVAVISFFFRLRVLDEIKDYELDLINHPHRVLQSGKITLRTLIGISVLGLGIEIGWSLWMGGPAIWAYGLALGYSALMRYEFFLGSWLQQRLVLYALLHMLVMPLIIAWLWWSYAAELAPRYFLLALLSLLAGFSFEIARKIHHPAAERATIDSYSKIMGLQASIALMLLLLLSGVVCQYYLLFTIASSLWSYLILALLYLFLLFFYLQEMSRPSELKLRKLELGVSLFMLVSYVSLILEIAL